MNNLSLVSIKQGLFRVLGRYHIVIFVVVVLGGLAVSIFLLNNTVNSSAEDTTYTSPLSSSFDQQTIERVEQLKTTNESLAPLDLTHGRTNPFVE